MDPAMSTRPDFRPGQRVGGRYLISNPVGRWQIGTAYAATEGRAETPRLILAMDLQRGALSQYLRWVRTEAEQARGLPEGLWVPLDGGHIFGDRVYMVLPELRGRSLSRVVGDEGSLSEERATRVAEAICRLVARAHAEGAALGCLRPSNVFLEPGAALRPAIFDVGLARGLSRLLARPPRASASYTPPDARPEMPVATDDVFAIGGLLYYMLTAKKPPASDANGLRVPTPPSWRRRSSELATYIDPVVMKAMAPLARDRYDYVEALADALQALVEVFRLSPDARAVLGLPGAPGSERPARHTHPHYLHDLLGIPAEPTTEIAAIEDPLETDD